MNFNTSFTIVVALVIGAFMFFVREGCEGESIRQCGYACVNAGKQMQGYSKNDGCRCGESLDAGAK